MSTNLGPAAKAIEQVKEVHTFLCHLGDCQIDKKGACTCGFDQAREISRKGLVTIVSAVLSARQAAAQFQAWQKAPRDIPANKDLLDALRDLSTHFPEVGGA